jgi:hypothetical protein
LPGIEDAVAPRLSDQLADGRQADVLQDEATKAESVSGLPMFGDAFPK